MNRNRWIAAATLVVLVLVAVILWFATRHDSYGETVEVTRGDIHVTIETVGTVELRDQSILSAPLTTRVETVAVNPGDEVRDGDVLVELDREPFDEAVEDAENALYRAETALSAIESEGDDASSLVERVSAQQEVSEAEEALARAERLQEQRLVLAPFDGMVISVEVEEGQPVSDNSDLIDIAQFQDYELIIEIDEIDLPLIEVGAEATIVLEAYPDRAIESEIHSIARRAETVGGTTVFPASIRFSAIDGITVLPGMNAEVEITTDVREDVLLLPEGSFQTVGRRTYVDVVVDGEVESREIRTGVSSGGMVEVADGLSEGDEVVVP